MARQKDFKGCLRCRTRKIKCGGESPSCIRCKKIARPCPGYSIELIWVRPNLISSNVQGRRGPSASSTWHGWPSLSAKDLEEELSNLDSPPPIKPRNASFKDPRKLFDVLDLGTPVSSNLSFSNPDWTDGSKFLFHHYIKNIAPQMTPLNGRLNPWAVHWPALAAENNSVRYALLSQAAAHLWHLQGQPTDLEIQLLRYRGAALACLRNSLGQRSTFCSFDATLSTALYLIMAEAYYGRLYEWRGHFSGAVDIALSNQSWSPWLQSESAWLATQSVLFLCLATRIDDKRLVPRSGPLFDASGRPIKPYSRCQLTVEVTGRDDYGDLFGMSYELANAFAECADVIAPWDEDILIQRNRMEVEHLTQRLLGMSLDQAAIQNEAINIKERLRSLHNHIFALGIVICLQRRTIDPAPSQIFAYTAPLFEGVEKFQSLAANPQLPKQCEFIPSLWPVFHAAVELYREQDQQHARHIWLERLWTSAVGNRKHIAAVVEKVWEVRRERARQQIGQATNKSDDDNKQGEIIVSWKDIAKDMGIDLILV